MSGVSERIAQLMESGRVSPSEARELLRAVERPRRSRSSRWLDPFESMDTGVGLGIAAGVAVAQLVLSRFSVRFDGALDLHLASQPPGLVVALSDGLVSWPLFAAVLWASGRLVAGEGRFVDFLWAVGVARAPLLVGAVLNRSLVDDPEALIRSVLEGPPDSAAIWVAFGTLPVLGWVLFWLYLAFRTASGARGVRGGLAFVVGVSVAEIGSKIVLGGLGS